MKFEWDDAKAAYNLKKHAISFGLAARVFLDQSRTEEIDLRHDYSEDRWRTTGLIDTEAVVVVYVHRADQIRLISARRANTHERNDYWQNRSI